MIRKLAFPGWLLFCAVALITGGGRGYAQLDFEQKPIEYSERPTADSVARLQAGLDAGAVRLTFDSRHGYLPAVLEQLGISTTSQMLVFSKTSFQLRRISSQRPRAVYFNDTTYVGWVQGGDVVEVATVDPDQGAVFYTLEQNETAKPVFVRDRGECLSCHASSRTQNVPGLLVRSVFADRSGQPQFGSGTFTIDHRSPLDKRWGGWYVTGQHGQMRHMGNAFSEDRARPDVIDREQGANVNDLRELVDVDPYLQTTSDIVALMVLEHQTQMHNFIIRANYEARSAAYQDEMMNAALGRPADYQSESSIRRIETAAEKLVEYLLFSSEFPLASPVRGAPAFTEQFAAQGPRDSRGRSLRDFDLQTRMFRYPCSYLIYSDAFTHLPATVQKVVRKRLREILVENVADPKFVHLSAADRQAIAEILRETQPGLLAAVE